MQKTEEELLAEQLELESLAKKNCIINVVAGSHAYGTNIEGSDWDERGIFADIKERVILPFDKIEQITFKDDDIVYFELSKYMGLLLEQNPNVLELIWTDKKDILYLSDSGKNLIDIRKELLSLRIKDSYVGYANGQLKRIKGHNKWINNPQPEREPEQGDFLSVIYNYGNNKNHNKTVPTTGYTALSLGGSNYSLWKNELLNIDTRKSWIDKRGNPIAIKALEMKNINTNNASPEMIVKINTKEFELTHENWKMYWKWKNTRNEKRSALEEKYGYDTKHAMHLIRLLRSGYDILQYGIVPVKREDYKYLLDVRNGVYTYEEILKESILLTEKIEKISEKSSLPEKPNRELAKEFMISTYDNFWKSEYKPKLNI